MTKPADSERMAEEIKQTLPSPEDRVRAIREKLENVRSGRWHKTLWVQSAPEDVADLLSLVEELKGQVAAVSASPQARCPVCLNKTVVLMLVGGNLVVGCPKLHQEVIEQFECDGNPPTWPLEDFAQFFALTPEPASQTTKAEGSNP
jgi:hypothetical protein